MFVVLDSHPGIRLLAVVQLMVIVDPGFIVPGFWHGHLKLSGFAGCPVQSDDNVSDVKRLYKNAGEYTQLT